MTPTDDEEILRKLAKTDPEAAWEGMVRLADSAPDDQSLRWLGCGLPEELIETQGEMLIERIEADARRDPRVRRMLCGVWQTTEMSDALWARVDALVAEYPEDDREGRGQSPRLRGLRQQGLWGGVPYPGGRAAIASLLGVAKTSYTPEELAPYVGSTPEQIRAEIDGRTLIGQSDGGRYNASLVAVLARYFPDRPRDAP